mgnify:CR=1 FL=1
MKVRIDEELCTGCGICETICPDAFQVGEDGVAHLIDDDACEAAACCVEAADNCPEEAITIEED